MKDDKPSLTAVMVAYTVLILGGDDYGRSRIPPGIIEAQIVVLVAAGLPFGTCPWVLCNPIMAKFARCLAAIWYPGFFQGIGFRKLIIDCQVRDFLRQQAQQVKEEGEDKTKTNAQVVVVAAGYDTLALRLCREYTNVTFWEVDHPATSRVKERVWADHSTKSSTTVPLIHKKNDTSTSSNTTTTVKLLGDKPSNMQHVKADLTKTHLDIVLKEQSNYDPSLPTIVIVEGLSMYLTEPQIRGLFDDIEKCTSPSTTATNSNSNNMVVFDFFGWNHRKQTVDVGCILPNLHRHGFTGGAEPWIWGLDPKDLPEFFSKTNWTLVDNVQSCGFENVAALKLDSNKHAQQPSQ